MSRGIGQGRDGRPLTHDLMLDALSAIGAKLERIEISRVDAPVFFATLVLVKPDGEEVKLDARPSDALALAVRSNAPMFVEDDVMNRVGTVSSPAAAQNDDSELEKFDEFVQTLSPDDF